MSPCIPRRVLPVLAVLTGLALPFPAQAASVRPESSGPAVLESLPASFWSWAVRLWSGVLQKTPLAAGLLRAEAAHRRADGAREVAAELPGVAAALVARLAGLGQARRAGQGGGGEQQGEEERWQILVHGGSPFGSGVSSPFFL